MKYIDADRLMAEIDKIEEEARKVRVSGTNKEAIGADSKVKLCLKLKSLIDSLQEELSEVDFEKEVDKLWQEGVNGLFGVNDSAVDFARIRNIALHFFNLGLNARRKD